MRILGVGFEGIRNFCGLMDLGQGICNSTYYSIVNHVKIAAEAVSKIVFRKAVKEEMGMNEEGHVADELTVSGDGSWARRGFSSLLGIVSLIGKYTNKLLDVVVKNRKMEVDGIIEMFQRSEELYNVK